MENLLAVNDKDTRARQRLDEQFAMFRSKHNTETTAASPASVSHAPETTSEEVHSQMPEAATITTQPPRKMETTQNPFEGIMEEAVFWQCVFSTDVVLESAELVRRTRYCGERFGIIPLPLPQYHSDRRQDTLALNLINRAHYDGLLTETERLGKHPFIFAHNHEYTYGTT